MTKVRIVFASDHDYDAMSQWLVGAFTTARRANAAIKKDRAAYTGHRGKKIGPDYDTYFVDLDQYAGYEQYPEPAP